MIVETTAAFLRLVRMVGGIEADLFRVFTIDGDPSPQPPLPPGIDGFVISADTPSAREYSLVGGDKVLCSAEIWWAATYRTKRNYFGLSDSETELVHLKTVPEARGRGLATDLLLRVARELPSLGLTRSYARVWHSNRASAQAFRKAGWSETALRIDLRARRWTKSFEIGRS